MKITRRQFIGMTGALGLSAWANTAGILRRIGFPCHRRGGKKDSATFAALNDLHVLDARSTAIVNKAVGQINSTPSVEFTVVLGDLATRGRLSELRLCRQSLGRLKQPYFVVPGNHDVEPGAADIYANYEKNFGEGNWTQKEDDWVFLGLDSCEGAASDVSIPPDRVQWLEKQLKKIKPGRPLALFCHHPFNPHTKAYRVKNAGDVLALFAGHNLKLVAAGHYHGNQVEDANGILFTTTACCSTTRSNFDNTPAKGYRLFHLNEDGIKTEFVEVKL